MNILFLSHYYPPEGNAPATRTFEHTRRWAAQGHRVTVLTCAPNVPHGKVYEGYRNALYQWETISNVNVLRVWTYLAANKGTGRRSFNYISYCFSAFIAGLFLRKPDVIIATTPQFFCACAGSLLSKVRNIPFMLEVRDIWPDSIIAVNAIQNSWILKMMCWLEQRLYQSASHIVTVGKGYFNVLRSKGVAAHRISVVPNGANLEQFQVTEKKLHSSPFKCSFIGTIGMAAKLDVVLKAAQHLDTMGEQDIHFELVGDGADLERLKRESAEAGLTRISFTGLVNKQEVLNHVAHTNVCLVHLKRSELFKTVLPSKMFEAMASGTPILLGVEGESADLVRSVGCGRTFQPENPVDLCKQLLEMKSDPNETQRMGAAGRTHVERFYNRDTLAQDYLNHISQLLLKHSS